MPTKETPKDKDKAYTTKAVACKISHTDLDTEALGGALRDLRLAKGLRLWQVQDALRAGTPRGFSTSQLSKVERGQFKHLPSSVVMQALAKLYEVEVDDLLRAAQVIPDTVGDVPAPPMTVQALIVKLLALPRNAPVEVKDVRYDIEEERVVFVPSAKAADKTEDK